MPFSISSVVNWKEIILAYRFEIDLNQIFGIEKGWTSVQQLCLIKAAFNRCNLLDYQKTVHSWDWGEKNRVWISTSTGTMTIMHDFLFYLLGLGGGSHGPWKRYFRNTFTCTHIWSTEYMELPIGAPHPKQNKGIKRFEFPHRQLGLLICCACAERWRKYTL